MARRTELGHTISRKQEAYAQRLRAVDFSHAHVTSFGHCRYHKLLEVGKALWDEEYLAGIRILHLASGRISIHIDVPAARIVGTEHVARFSRHNLGRRILRGRTGHVSRRRAGRRFRLFWRCVSRHSRSGAWAWLGLRRDLPLLRPPIVRNDVTAWSDYIRSDRSRGGGGRGRPVGSINLPADEIGRRVNHAK